MKKVYRLHLLLIFIGIFSIFCVSCKKFVEIPVAPNLIVTSQVFSDSTDASAAVLYLYVTMMNSINSLSSFSGNITLYTGLSSDELYPTAGSTTEKALYSNSLLPTTGSVFNFWTDAYPLIYRANSCIEGVSASSGIGAGAKNQMIGEAKVIRAFWYFNLVNLFGDVPLVTSTDYKVNAVMPRTPVDSVYRQIISDLVDAQSLLSVNYPSAGRVRANQYTATALLARVYLYQKKWVQAETAATQIISSGNYNLETSLNNVFLAGSKEAILQLLPALAGYETPEGNVFVPTTTTTLPKYVISNYLFTAFETIDQRKVPGNWLKSNTVGGTAYYYPYKYKLGQDGLTTSKENYMVFRLAEQYLIRAEARVQQNNITDASTDLNEIRKRAGLPSTTATTQDALLSAIYHERQVELFCEWGHRWYDLKRTGRVDSVMTIVTPTKGGTWSTTQQVYPIATTELQKNPFLIQNPGYQ